MTVDPKVAASGPKAEPPSVVAVDLRATVRKIPALGDRGLPISRSKLRGIYPNEIKYPAACGEDHLFPFYPAKNPLL